MKTTKNVVAKIAGVILAGMMVMGLASCGDEGAPSLVGKTFECSKTIQGEDVIATLNFTSETAGTMYYFVKGQSSGEVYRDLDIPFAYEAGNTPKTGDGSIAKASPYHYLITWDESKFDKKNGAEESWIRNTNSLFFNIKEYKAAKEIAELKGGQGNERPSSGLQLYSFKLLK